MISLEDDDHNSVFLQEVIVPDGNNAATEDQGCSERFFLVLFQFFVEYGHASIPEFAFQVRSNGTSARGDENTIRHLIHKDTGDSIPRPVHDPEHTRIRRNQFPVAFHAMMIISLYGRAKSNG